MCRQTPSPHFAKFGLGLRKFSGQTPLPFCEIGTWEIFGPDHPLPCREISWEMHDKNVLKFSGTGLGHGKFAGQTLPQRPPPIGKFEVQPHLLQKCGQVLFHSIQGIPIDAPVFEALLYYQPR